MCGFYDWMGCVGGATLNGAQRVEGSGRGELWDDNTLSLKRRSETAMEGDRQVERREEEEEEGEDVAHATQLGLAQVGVRPSPPPFLPSAAVLSCKLLGAARVGWGVDGRTEVEEWMEGGGG